MRYVRHLVRGGAIGGILSTSVLGTGDRWGPEIDPSVTYLLDRDNGATLLTIPFGHALDAVCHVLGEFSALSAATATRRTTVRRTDAGGMVPSDRKSLSHAVAEACRLKLTSVSTHRRVMGRAAAGCQDEVRSP